MNVLEYEIVEIEKYSGVEAKVYTIILRGEKSSIFDKFLTENLEVYRDEVKSIIATLFQIGHTTGARYSFFKHHEGKYGDNVCALFDSPDKHLRLYCIRFGMDIIILGGGGVKPRNIIAWQEDEKLNAEASQIISIAKDIGNKIDLKEIYWSKDHKSIEGNLKTYEDEQE